MTNVARLFDEATRREQIGNERMVYERSAAMLMQAEREPHPACTKEPWVEALHDLVKLVWAAFGTLVAISLAMWLLK